MRTRMTIALLALVNSLVAFYLHLFKLGVFSTLQCSTGGCEKAMFSPFGYFLRVDVALIGAIGYALLFAVALVSLQPRWQAQRWPVVLLLVLATLGLAFTVRLKYGEWVVLHTVCLWCAISVVSITTIWILAIAEWRRTRSTDDPSS